MSCNVYFDNYSHFPDSPPAPYNPRRFKNKNIDTAICREAFLKLQEAPCKKEPLQMAITLVERKIAPSKELFAGAIDLFRPLAALTRNSAALLTQARLDQGFNAFVFLFSLYACIKTLAHLVH
jgi:hypothetical protein